jgi:HAD superfamily hydrolase (TIGR01509 family)
MAGSVKTRHIVFDCDGVLVDSEPLSMRADVMLLKRFGITLTEEEAHRRFVGKTFEAMLNEMAAECGVTFPQGLSAEKDRVLEGLFRKDLKIVTGVEDILDMCASRSITVSVASNSPRERVLLALDLTGIAQHFATITTFEDVISGKPAPDVYILALDRAHVPGSACLVVEDSATGVTSAVAAGLRTIGFTATHHDPATHAATLKARGAAETIGEMNQLKHLLDG